MDAFPWTCPFCGRDTTITSENYRSSIAYFTIENAHGPRGVSLQYVVCPNKRCKEFTLAASLYTATPYGAGWNIGNRLKHWRLIPASEAKVFPGYVPAPILADYLEACLIRELSPKASATLARRCLQGMIRDFWDIRKARLIDEIEAIKDKIDPLTWQAIDAVRSIGNIGAHMEKDINLIVDVEPDEAAQLIGLIEILVRDWYITRHERQERLKGIVSIADEKAAAKSLPSTEAEVPGEKAES